MHCESTLCHSCQIRQMHLLQNQVHCKSFNRMRASTFNPVLSNKSLVWWKPRVGRGSGGLDPRRTPTRESARCRHATGDHPVLPSAVSESTTPDFNRGGSRSAPPTGCVFNSGHQSPSQKAILLCPKYSLLLDLAVCLIKPRFLSLNTRISGSKGWGFG